MSSRPEYNQVDKEYRDAQLSSRNSLMHKASEVDLWMKVIHRALNDIALYTEAKDHRDLTEEEEEYLYTANEFIFNDDWRFPISDYYISISCYKCHRPWTEKMSRASSDPLYCPKCKSKISWKNIEYEVLETEELKDISLKELLDIWDIENLSGFRSGAEKYIKYVIQKIKDNRKSKNTKKTIKPIKTKEIKSPVADFFLTSYTIEELKQEQRAAYKRRSLAKKAAKESEAKTAE